MSTLKLIPRTEALIDDLSEMTIDSFTTNPGSRLMNGPPTPANRQAKRERDHASFQKRLLNPNPNSFDLVLIDTSLPPTNPSVPEGAIIAQANWLLEREGDMYMTDVDATPPLPGGNVEAKRVFWAAADADRHRCIQGRPAMHLTIICTSPKFRRRGAARFLVEWGMRKAEELGVPAYLGSSEAGRPLYLSCGFRQTEEWLFDLTPFGGEGGTMNYSFMYYPESYKGPKLEGYE